MNTIELRNRVVKVITSCTNETQLESAIRYANLALLQTPGTLRLKHTVMFERALAVTQYRLNHDTI